MADSTQPDGSPPSFASRWALPILFGCFAGFVTVFTGMTPLIDQFGDLLGALAGIGLGFAVALVAIMLCRLVGRLFFG